MQTLTPQEEGACVGTEMSGGQPLPSCRTSNLNPPRLTSRRSQPPLALAVPLSRFTSRVGGGSAFYVRPLHTLWNIEAKATDGRRSWSIGGFCSWPSLLFSRRRFLSS